LTHRLNINYLKHSGKILSSALFLAKDITKPGMSTALLDRAINYFIIYHDAVPSFIGIGGYKYASCISINSQIVHGAPSENTIIKEGDLITVDIGVSYKHNCTDAARTFVVGVPTRRQRKLIDAAQAALDAGVSKATFGNRVGDISYAIQTQVETRGFKSPLDYGGHGIGLEPHMDPFISNTGVSGTGEALEVGMCLAIEPIVMEGSPEVFEDESDGYTVYSEDGRLSSHIEDTVVVVGSGRPIILTRRTLSGKPI
jgi:methionyl aminopeptidase